MSRIKTVNHLSRVGVRALNEDRVLVNEQDNIFGVFDGASSLVSYLSPDKKTGAYIAARIAAETFAKATKDLKETAIIASDKIEVAQLAAGIDVRRNVNRFGTTAAVVRIIGDQAELLQIGDSVIVVIHKNMHTEVPLGYQDHDIEIMRKWRQLADAGVKSIRTVVADDVIELRESANSAYGLLNGDKRVEHFCRTATISLEDVSAILIVTDGMFLPKANPDADENWGHYAELYIDGGLEKILKTIRKLEDSDPELIKFPRYKVHDDASAVAINLHKSR